MVASYATKYPKRVRKILLGSLGAKMNQALFKVIEKGKVLVAEKNFSGISQILPEDFGQSMPEQMKKAIQVQFSRITEEQIKVFKAQSEFVESVNYLTDIIDPTMIKVNTLMINGEKDTIIDVKDNEAFAKKIKKCKRIVVPGVGHFLHFENEQIMNMYE